MTIKSEILIKRTSSTMGAQDLLPTKIARLNDHPSFQGLPEELQNSIFQMANDPGLSVVNSSFQRLNLVALESSWNAFESAICGLSENQRHPLFAHYIGIHTLNPNANWHEKAKALIQKMCEYLQILDPEAFQALCPKKRTLDLKFCVDAANRLKEINDRSLQLCWGEIRSQITRLEPVEGGNLPPLEASAEQIKNWLNQPESQGMILTIRNLRLSDLDLPSIPRELSHFINLRRLDLSKNLIRGILPGTFDSLPLLRRLDLSANQISALPENLFFECVELTYLSFKNNLLKEIPQLLFSSCPLLNSFNCSLNELTEIPEQLFIAASKIEKVNFSGNRIRSIPTELFNDCFNLDFADFSVNQLDALSPELFHDCFDLNTVYLYNNRIVEIPNNFFVTNTYLENVDFGNNRIKTINKHLFGECIHLISVCFSYNEISEINDDLFENCTQLESLDLDDNKIEYVSQTFCIFCENIRVFSFNNNPYALNIRDAFRWNQQLRECFLRDLRQL